MTVGKKKKDRDRKSESPGIKIYFLLLKHHKDAFVRAAGSFFTSARKRKKKKRRNIGIRPARESCECVCMCV